MNKDNAKDYLPLVQALADGKTIQAKCQVGMDQFGWRDREGDISFHGLAENYRIKPEPRDGEADAAEIRRLKIELAELKRVIAEQSKADKIPGEVWITFDSNGLYEEIEYNRFDVLDAEQRMQRRAERLGLRSVKFVRAE